MGQPVLLLDEPFANLDQASIQTCLTLLKDSCHAEQTTVLLTSHQRVGITEHLDYELILEEQTLKLGDTKLDKIPLKSYDPSHPHVRTRDIARF